MRRVEMRTHSRREPFTLSTCLPPAPTHKPVHPGRRGGVSLSEGYKQRRGTYVGRLSGVSTERGL